MPSGGAAPGSPRLAGMTTLPEELLLLSLMPTGKLYDKHRVGFGLPAAILGELTLAGRIGTVQGRVWVIDGGPTGDPALDGMLHRLAGRGSPVPAWRWVHDHHDYFRRSYLDRLARAGMVQQRTHKSLGMFETQRYHPAPDAQGQVRQRLDMMGAGQAWPDPRGLLLAALAHGIGLVPRLFLGPADPRTDTRLAQLTAWDSVGATLVQAIKKARDAAAAAAAAAATPP